MSERTGTKNGLVGLIRAYAETVESFSSEACFKAIGRDPHEVGRALCAEVRRGRLFSFGSRGHGRRKYTKHQSVVDAYFAAGGKDHYASPKRVRTRQSINSPWQQSFIDALRKVGQATTSELAPMIGLTSSKASHIGIRLVVKGLVWSRPIHMRQFMFFATKELADAFVEVKETPVPHNGIPTDSMCARMVSIIGPEGIDAPTAGRILSIQAKSAVRVLRRAVQIGMLHEARQPKNWNWRVFFVDKAARDAYAEKAEREHKELAAEKNRRKQANRRATRAAAAAQRPDVLGRKDLAVRLLQERGSLTAGQLAEVAVCDSRQASSSLISAVAAGEAFVGKLNAHRAVYFARKEDAENLQKIPPKRVRAPKGKAKFAVVPEKPSVEVGVKLKNHGRPVLTGEIIVPPHVKVVECDKGYTHNHRYALAPEQPFEGAGFRRIGIGRYLESEPA